MTDLRQLRYFLAVAETRSYRRAAETLAVSQPALSQRIKALEEDIGVLLFARSSKGVTLTPAGEAFRRGARQILRDLDLTIASTRLADQSDSGTLAVAFNELAGQQPMLGRCLSLFRAAFPNVAVGLSEMGAAEQQDALRTGNIDAGFHYRTAGNPAHLAYRILDEQTFMLALPEDHVLARHSSVPLHSLDGAPMVRLRRDINAETHDGIVQAFAAAHIRPHIVVEASSDAAMLALVAAGLGLAIIMGGDRRGGWQGLALRPIEGLALSKQFVLAWDVSNRSAPLAKFLALVERSLEAQGRGK